MPDEKRVWTLWRWENNAWASKLGNGWRVADEDDPIPEGAELLEVVPLSDAEARVEAERDYGDKCIKAQRRRNEDLKARLTVAHEERLRAERRVAELEKALRGARAELVSYIQGESGLPHAEPYVAVRTALEKHIDPALAPTTEESDAPTAAC